MILNTHQEASVIFQHKEAANIFRFRDDLSTISNMNEFVRVVNRIAGSGDPEDVNPLKGDLYECLVEYFIRTMGGDEFVPIDRDGYNPNTKENGWVDGGVDGVGTYDGRAKTVQCKFKGNRFNAQYGYVTYTDVSKFCRQSFERFNINPHNLHGEAILFTTGAGYNQHELEISNNHPLIVPFDTFDRKIGQGNSNWWSGWLESLSETYNVKKTSRCDKEPRPHQKDCLHAITSFLGAV